MWKPIATPVDNIVLFDQDILEAFVKSRLILEDKNTFSIASLINYEFNVFICSQPESDVHEIQYCLWSPNADKKRVFEKLVSWHEDTFAEYTLRIASRDGWEFL